VTTALTMTWKARTKQMIDTTIPQMIGKINSSWPETHKEVVRETGCHKSALCTQLNKQHTNYTHMRCLQLHMSQKGMFPSEHRINAVFQIEL